MTTSLWGYSIPVGVFFLGAGILGTIAFYLMDRFWYHQLLYGAVQHGLTIERQHAGDLPELGLTKSIGDASPAYFPPRGWKAFKFRMKIHSARKIDLFYAIMIIGLGVIASFLLASCQPVAGSGAVNQPTNSVATNMISTNLSRSTR